MQYFPPVMVHTSEDTYQTQVYLDIKYDLDNIKKCILHGFLSKTSIPRGQYTLNIYDIADEGFNLFVLGPKEIEEHHGLSAFDTVCFIDTFLTHEDYSSNKI